MSNKKKSTQQAVTQHVVVRKSINVWEFARAVLVPAINKGQAVQVGLVIVFTVAIIRMPAADVSKLVFQLVDGLKTGYYLGWLLAVAFLVAWFLHAKSQRRWWSQEMNRLAQERTKYQAKALPDSLGTSIESA